MTVLGGSALVLGWAVIPLVSSGIEQTLDPARLVTFPIPLNQLLVGLTMAGVLGIPGIVTTIASLATALTWWKHPAAAVIAIVCAAIGALTCVIASRTVSALSSRLASGRRFKEITGILIIIPLIFLGPIFASLAAGAAGITDIPAIADAVAWSPLGAIWAVPSEVVLGSYGDAIVKFVIGVATPAVLMLLWKRSLASSLYTAPRSSSRTKRRGKLGFFDFLPGTPTGAVAARALTYWMRDPRYARQLIVIPLLPVFLYVSSINREGTPFLFSASAPFVAMILSITIYADISFDGTAYATHMAAGLRGRADRAGRVIAVSLFAVPLVIIISIATSWVTGTWSILMPIMGISLGLLLTGFGVSSVVSARMVFPVPNPGDSPFKSTPGGGVTSTLAMFAAWGILIGLALPELILGIVAITVGSIPLGGLALLVGIALGVLFAIIGIRMGGATLDRRSPELLVQLQRIAS